MYTLSRICTLSVELYSDVTSVDSVFVTDKIINSSDFRKKCLSYSKISATLCVLNFCFYTFLFNLGEHVNWYKKNFVLLVIFDTCDVVYNWSISLLPPIVLDNLFGPCRINTKIRQKCLNKIAQNANTIFLKRFSEFFFFFSLLTLRCIKSFCFFLK